MQCKRESIREKSKVKNLPKIILCKKSAKLLMLTRAAGGLGSRRVEELSAATVENLLFLEAFFNN